MTVIHAMLGNAVLAAVLALIALVIGLACRSPTIRHAAWVIVLLKLVTPPLISIPLPVLPASRRSFRASMRRLRRFPPSMRASASASSSPTP